MRKSWYIFFPQLCSLTINWMSPGSGFKHKMIRIMCTLSLSADAATQLSHVADWQSWYVQRLMMIVGGPDSFSTGKKYDGVAGEWTSGCVYVPLMGSGLSPPGWGKPRRPACGHTQHRHSAWTGKTITSGELTYCLQQIEKKRYAKLTRKSRMQLSFGIQPTGLEEIILTVTNS